MMLSFNGMHTNFCIVLLPGHILALTNSFTCISSNPPDFVGKKVESNDAIFCRLDFFSKNNYFFVIFIFSPFCLCLNIRYETVDGINTRARKFIRYVGVT